MAGCLRTPDDTPPRPSASDALESCGRFNRSASNHRKKGIPMKLYYAPGACSMTPHIVLREAGHKFDLEKVDIPNKKTEHGDDFWKVNPKGYVPALKLDGGEVLTEVGVIAQYLADQKPDSGLAPRLGTMERYHLMEWMNFISSEVHKQIGALFNPKMTPEMKEVQLGTVTRRLNALEKLLDGKQFAMGDKFSVADAYLFNIINWTKIHKIDLAPWPNIKAHLERVGARPKVQETLKAEGLLK
jgi:glutathione S-transferase